MLQLLKFKSILLCGEYINIIYKAIALIYKAIALCRAIPSILHKEEFMI